MAKKDPTRAARRREQAESEHRFAMDDLQDAVDRTMEEGGVDAGMDNLRRAAGRENAAHDALAERRRRRPGGGKP